MNQYTITGRQRIILLIMIAVGVVSMGLTFLGDDQYHTRFWTNLLHNATFFTGIGLMATFFIAVCITAWAGWSSGFKRVWEAMSAFLGPGLLIMGVIAIATWMHGNHLYHWNDPSIFDPADPEKFDKILYGKKGFLNRNVYLGGTIIVGLIWYFFRYKLRSLSVAEDSDQGHDFANHRTQRVWAAAFLPIVGFSSAFLIWQWIMSLDSHWYSTMFAWYTGASWFVSMIAFTIILLIYLKGKGYYENITGEHIHDLGKFLFGFSIFWTYLWFSQYMLIWYANVGEETIYFRERHDNYPILFWGNLVMNFALPFLILMRNDTKRKFGSVSFVAALVIFGHWWDFFQMIKPGALHSAHRHSDHFNAGFTLPGFLELGTAIGFLGLFLYVTFYALSKAALLPKNDPYLAESLHHHV